jgi:hypothetical protein
MQKDRQNLHTNLVWPSSFWILLILFITGWPSAWQRALLQQKKMAKIRAWPSSGFLPPTISYVTYDVVRHARTTSYVPHTTSCSISCVRCRTCDIQDIDAGYRTCYVVCHVRCRMSTYDIMSDTYDIVDCRLNISYTMSYVRNGPTISYVHDIRYRRFISYTKSYVSYMTYDVAC